MGLYRVYLGVHAARSDLRLATNGLSEHCEIWEIDKVAFKRLPACYLTIAAIDAACTLHHKHGLRAGDIETVCVLLPQAAAETACLPVAIRRKPADTYAAVFSVYYGVAVALARGCYGLSDLELAALADPRVLALIERTEAALLARAIRWMTTEPRCANQQFNITNGDYIRWKILRPVFADYFGMKLGAVNTQRLGLTNKVRSCERSEATIPAFKIAVIVLRARSNRLTDLRPLAPDLLACIPDAVPGAVTYVGD